MKIGFETPAGINPRTGRPIDTKLDKHPMIELDTTRTIYARTRRNQTRKIVVAYSADGVWQFTHHEDGGSTWTATHLPTGQTLDCIPSLPTARRYAESGHALKLIASQTS